MVGVYQLSLVNGAAAPAAAGAYQINGATCAHTGRSGSLELTKTRGYILAFTVSTTCSGPPGTAVVSTLQESGTWTISGAALALSRTGGSTLGTGSATLSGSTVTVPATIIVNTTASTAVTLAYTR